MSDDKIQQKSNAGIFIGPGATGVKTQGNRIRGFDHGIEDHGKDGHHEHNEIDANKPNLLIKQKKTAVRAPLNTGTRSQ